MATIDLSRHATDPRKHYTGVRMKQGQVLTDDDFNEGARIDHDDMRRSRVDIIGPVGAPNAGFKIANPTFTAGKGNFDIKAGTLYLGGHRLQLEADEKYQTQRDWLRQAAGDAILPPALGATRYDMVWLEAWEQGVSAVEDSELFEVALAGPDTSARVRVVRRVYIQPGIGSADCKAAWTTLTGTWTALGTLQPDLELKPDATLEVTYGPPGNPADLCSPPVQGGYLGAYNQAIRVQLLSNNQLLWALDNAAPLYRVQVVNDGTRRVIKMLTVPKDKTHAPLVGQVAELLPWSAVIANRVTTTGALDHCEKIAELSGHLGEVDASFNPNDKTFKLKVANAVPLGFGEEWTARPDAAEIGVLAEMHFYLRMWNKIENFAVNNPTPLGNTGISVTLRGTQLRKNDHWIVAARPATAKNVVPWQLDVPGTGRPPHGYRIYRTPLAVIKWTTTAGGPGGTNITTGVVVDDCRDTFLPLTKIKSCCSYTVGDGVFSFGHFTKIQDAIDALPIDGGEVCVLPGHFYESVLIKDRANITVHGCGERSIVESPSGPNAPPGPVFKIEGSTNIRIERLQIIAHDNQPGVLVDLGGQVERLYLHKLKIIAGPRCAIEIIDGQVIEITDCDILMRSLSGPWPAIFSGADYVLIERNQVLVSPPPAAAFAGGAHPTGRGGIQLGGGSEHVRVINNLIQTGIGNGITLGSLKQIGGGGGGIIIFWVVDPFDPCDPCKPGDIVVVIDPAGHTSYESAGDLYDILIERNRIFDMGLNGIGVVGFFDPTVSKQIIHIDGLRILGNEIRKCLWRQLQQIPQKMQAEIGYGGISLAAVTYLLIRGNDIIGNGFNHIDPICGIFVRHGAAVEIVDNRIFDNGQKTEEPASNARPGARSGIYIGLAWPILRPKQLILKAAAPVWQRSMGATSAKIHDNVVSQPLGRSLTLFALGHASVQDNRLVSLGVPFKDLPYFLAANVMIIDLGLSNELPIRLLADMLGGIVGAFTGKPPVLTPCADARVYKNGDVLAGLFAPSAKTLFCGNQCTLDLMYEEQQVLFSAHLVLSLDDIGFNDNQLECDLALQFVIANCLLAAMSVRMADNRCSEGWIQAWWSAVTLAAMNATTNNQGTHCIAVFGGIPILKVDKGNRAIMEAFCPDFCRRDVTPDT